MKRFRQVVVGGFAALIMSISLLSFAPPQASAAVVTNGNPTCAKRFLTLPVWYRGLTKADDNCELKSPAETGGISKYIWTIVLNVIEIVLQLIGFVSVLFIMYGGFQYLTNGYNPSVVEAARKTITNAVVGLAISISATGLVTLAFGILNGLAAI